MPEHRATWGWTRCEPRILIVALLGASIPFVATTIVAYSTLHGRFAGGEGSLAAPLGDTTSPLFLAIVLRNGSVALGLFSGVLTLGIGSLLVIAFQVFVVGASTAAAATEVGVHAAISSVAGYAVVEIPALLLAATGGLLPISSVATPSSRLSGLSPTTRYVSALRGALVLLGLALGMIVLAAGVETFLITSRSS